MFGKLDLGVSYDLQGVYKKEIDNYHFYIIKISSNLTIYINAKLFWTSGGIPLLVTH